MDGFCDAVRRFVHLLVLPDADDIPTRLAKELVDLAIALAVPAHLLSPVASVGDCDGVVLRATVPKAAVDEYGDLRAGEQQVRGVAQIWKGPGGDAVPQAEAVHCGAESELGSSVAGAVRLHAGSHGGR
jgi:hypothetical protein